MAVAARFFVQEIVKQAGPSVRVKLGVAVRGDNSSWSKYTPVGTIEMGVLNEAASAWFEDRLGTDVAVTFDDVPKG